MSKQKSFNSLDSLGGLVFSTDPNVKLQADPEPVDTPLAAKQTLRIWLERIKGGKEATVIKGFEGSDDALADLAKTLKNKCAAGGNAKDGVIIIQGNHREKVLKLLLDMGFKHTKNAGG
jgi:translation initiation factor 1